MSAVINSTLLSAAACAQFRANLLTIKFSKLFAQPVYRETLSGGEKELHDRLGGDLPHPFSLWSSLAHRKKKSYESKDDWST